MKVETSEQVTTAKPAVLARLRALAVLWRFATPYRARMLVFALALLVAGACFLVIGQGLKQVIDRYVYTGQVPLPDPDIVNLIQKPLGILERGPTRKRVLEKVVDFVATFIRGVAA